MARIGGPGHADLLSGVATLARRGAFARLALASAILVGGCAEHIDALDDVVAVPVHVARDGAEVVVTADLWAAPEARILVCPEPPIEDRDQILETGVLVLAESCHDYGNVRSEAGRLDARLSVAFQGEERTRFDAAPDWWIVLIAVRPAGAGLTYTTRIPGGSAG